MKPWKYALCAVALLMPSIALAQRGENRDVKPPRADPQFVAAFRGTTAAAAKSTVRVLCDGKEVALGTVVGPDGWVLTKYSLLTEPVSCKLKDGRVLEARVVGAHEKFDLAMLKVEATGLAAVTFTESKTAPVGSWLVSVGTDEAPVALGVMSVASRSPAPTRRGGAPRPAAPVAAGTDLLGLRVAAEEKGLGAKVDWVFSRSAAEKAGVKMDDTLLSVQGKAVTDRRSLRALLGTMKPGDVVTLKLLRGGKELELKAKLEPRRPPRGRPDQNRMGSELSERRTGFPTYFQSDTVLKPKDCGGPVCDLDGHVLGVNIARAGRVESYTVPSEAITPLLADLMLGKLPPKTAAMERQVRELRAALKKAESDKATAEARLHQARESLQKQEAARAEAEKRAKAAREALEKAQKELKEKRAAVSP